MARGGVVDPVVDPRSRLRRRRAAEVADVELLAIRAAEIDELVHQRLPAQLGEAEVGAERSGKVAEVRGKLVCKIGVADVDRFRGVFLIAFIREEVMDAILDDRTAYAHAWLIPLIARIRGVWRCDEVIENLRRCGHPLFRLIENEGLPCHLIAA